MKHQDFIHGWLFEYSAEEEWLRRGARGQGQKVNLPHDFRIALTPTPTSPGGANEAYYPGGYGYYEKSFEVEEHALSQPLYLYLDGVYRMCEVRLNNQLLCLHKAGYSPFSVRLNDALKAGKNTLFLRVNASLLPGSRWYPGAGIYRGVELLHAKTNAYVLPDGLWLDTLSLEGNEAVVAANARVSNSCKKVRLSLLDKGEVVAEAVADVTDGLAEAKLTLVNCYPWSAETPYLYTLRAEVLDEKGAVVDTEEVSSGIRTVSVSVNEGLLINGKPVKLKGGCVHHDCGLIGSASHRGAEWRKAYLLKQNGFNAVRCAHNPPSASFLRACDSLGLYVMDEAFDAWCEGKRAMDEHLYFEETWQEQIQAMVNRDRRHASVILWSTGNEVQERSGVSDGAKWAKRLADYVRQLDETRPVTCAICGFFEETELQEMALNAMSTLEEGNGKDYWAAKSEGFLAPLDVCGYNYLLDRYEKDHALFPERIFLGTESFPMEALANWKAVEEHPYLIGDFVWTALDYLGEAGIGNSNFESETAGLPKYPWRIANCGDLDITGRKRPQSHYRDFIWTDRTTPYLCVQHPRHFGRKEFISRWGWEDLLESWTFPGFDGEKVQVTAYARGEMLRLYANGQMICSAPIVDYKATFTIPYTPGLLEAVALDERGEEIGRCCLATAGKPAALRLHAEEKNMPGTKLRYVWIELVDEKGTVCPDATNRVRVTTQGCRLLGLGSADPCTTDNYMADNCALYHGRALAVLRRESTHPSVAVSVDGLPSVTLLI